MGHRQRASTEAVRGLKNPNLAFDQTHMTLWQRASDVIASVAASPWFTSFHAVWFGTWIVFNLVADKAAPVADKLAPAAETKSLAFDPFPFGLLTMVVSLEAIFLAIFVMVSQNRQSQKDRLHIDLDYQINVKAQTEIMKIARRLERMENVLLKSTDEAPQGKDSSH
jgi:uncharacterized membrane protein